MAPLLPVLEGLLLAGGQSTRMGADKAAQRYDGQTQLARAWRLLAPLCAEARVCIRAAQAKDPLRARYPCQIDLWEESGPMSALATAFRRCPERAFLVLACDLPLLDAHALQALVRARQPCYAAVAYVDPHDGEPEPLCTVYEPSLAEPVEAAMRGGRRSLRRLLADASLRRLPAPAGERLLNVNTPRERERVAHRLRGPSHPPD